jgi:alpha/beta superfamily hydrolase
MEEPRRIRANSVLPARRERVSLATADGLDLVAELALPLSGEPVATMVCLHPLPTQGGMMDSHVFRKAAARLPALAQIAVLRFNTRGTTSAHGTSDGRFDEAGDERYDVAAAIEYAEFAELPAVWLVGWSFGTDLALKYGNDPAVTGAILLSPALRYCTESELGAWATSGKPLVAVVPEYDDYLRPAEARRRFAVVPQAEVIDVPDGRHLWVGQADTVLDIVVAHLNPAAAPVPRTWNGEMDDIAPSIVEGP